MNEQAMLSQLQEIMSRAREQPDGYLTTGEWSSAWGCGSGKTRQLLGVARRNGLMDCARVPRERMDGVYQAVQAYRVRLEDGDGAK
jgi:hypothetical protein